MSGWPKVRLDACCDVVSGATPKTGIAEFWGGEICWATPADLSGLNSQWIEDTPRKITEKGLRSCAANVLPSGSVLLSSRAPIGHVAINKIPMATNQGFKSLVPHAELIDASYLYHWLCTHRLYLESLGNGATFKEVSKSVISKVEIPLPPLAEQRRIAELLDQLDELRTKRRKAIVLLDELTQSIFLDMFGDPTLNNSAWPVVTVATAGNVQLGRQRAPKYQTGKYTKPYLRVANVFEDRIDTSDVLSMDFDSSDFEKYRLVPGDILLNEGQSTELVGRPAMWRDEIPGCCFQNTLVRFRPRLDIVEPEYALAVFLRLFRTGQFAKISSKTSSVAHLGASRFAKMPFLLPPLQVQRSYVARAHELQTLRASFASHMGELEELFASLQEKAFRREL
jgi:type I restriction enzyme S subunit